MNTPFIRILALAVIICFTSQTPAVAQSQQDKVNAVIGDESFTAVFGKQPDESVNEIFRIQLHLAYVEEQLRAKI